MKYTVTAAGHPPLTIELPQDMTITAGSPEHAEAVIAQLVTDDVVPRLTDQPPYKEIERDDQGRVTRVIERPAVSAAALAAAIGREVARRHMQAAGIGTAEPVR